MNDLIAYMKLCRNSLCKDITAYNLECTGDEKKTSVRKQTELQIRIDVLKKQMQILFTQKIRDLANAHGCEKVINESYDAMQK